MEKIVNDLKNIFKFKDSTREGDIVLIVAEQLLYGLVTEITRDDTRRDEWWHVTMQLLTIPPQKVTWTLREPQFTGQEIFTMGGEKRFIKSIDFGLEAVPGPEKKKSKGQQQPKRPVLKVVK